MTEPNLQIQKEYNYETPKRISNNLDITEPEQNSIMEKTFPLIQ